MARRIRISALSGSRTLACGGNARQSYSIMKDFWKREMERVAWDKPDFVVLPEACDRFLDMDEEKKPSYDAIRENQSIEFFSDLAVEYETAVVFNTKLKNRNTSYACLKDGSLAGKYDKVYPMDSEIEGGIIPGEKPVVFEFGKIRRAGFAVCFDLNFKELKDEYTKLKPEVMFFSSMYHGGFVQKTWAYETRSYFVSAICGHPCGVTAPNGRVIAKSTNYTPNCTADINLDSALIHLDYHVDKLREIKKKYGDGISIDDVGYLGSVLVSCEAKDITIDDVIKEFELVRLDDYLDSSRKIRDDALKK